MFTALNRAEYPQAIMKATITVFKEDYLKAILETETEG